MNPDPHNNVDNSTVPVAVSLAGVRFRWSETVPHVLDIPRLEVASGQRVFIGGPSGSGKSTLLSLLAGIVPPQEGTIQLLGQCLNRMTAVQRDQFRADHLGYVFQMFNLVPYLSVVENVLLPARFSARRLDCVRAAGGAESEARRLLDHLGMGADGLLHRPVTQLSVGQQQRVAVARALFGGPSLVIADEPTSALDADNRASFLELLFQECRQSGATLVFVSHDTALAPLFDRQFALPVDGVVGEVRR